jgi:hypothetical protein
MLVGRGDPGPRIDHEKDDVGLGDRHFGLAAHARFQTVIIGVLIPGGIDQIEGQIADAAQPLAAVAATLFDVIVRDKDPAAEDVPTVLFPAQDAENR